MSKYMRKGIGLLLVFLLTISSGVSAFATTEAKTKLEDDTLSIVQLTEGSYLMRDGDSEAVLNIEETETGERVSVLKERQEEYFIIDREQGQVYSSYTGEYVPIDELIEDEEVLQEQGATSNNTRGTGDIVETYVTNVSFRSIHQLIGEAYDAYDLASTIATIILAATGASIPTLAALVLDGLTGIGISTVLNKVKNNASGGIRFTIYKCEITKHQGGRIVKGYGYKLGGASLYS